MAPGVRTCKCTAETCYLLADLRTKGMTILSLCDSDIINGYLRDIAPLPISMITIVFGIVGDDGSYAQMAEIY